MSNALKGLLWLIIAVVVLAGGYALYTLLRPAGAEPAAPRAISTRSRVRIDVAPYRGGFASAGMWPQVAACAAAPLRRGALLINVTDVFVFGSHPC